MPVKQIAWLWVWLAIACFSTAAGSPEERTKADYLFKFAAFVRWPATAFDSPVSPLAICTSGEDPIGAALEETTRGQHVDGRTVEIRHLDSPPAPRSCHILFASGPQTEEMLHAVASEPVLTVTEGGTGDAAGIIQFLMNGGRVRFMVDHASAQQHRITISSKLLDLAVSVTK